ncbi:MAG: MerR family transcriptional regulator [Caulobacteraceae bacterium]
MVVAKGPDAFRTISEASDELGVPQHVLRFWETKFSFIRPMKRAGGRRFYRPQDLEVLAGVRTLLHQQGYTIKGVQRLHKEFGVRRLVKAAGGDAEAVAILEAERDADPHGLEDAPLAPLSEVSRGRLRVALGELEAAKARIDALLAPAAPNS